MFEFHTSTSPEIVVKSWVPFEAIGGGSMRWIDPFAVDAVVPTLGGTTLFLRGGRSFNVKGTPKQVLEELANPGRAYRLKSNAFKKLDQ